MRTLTPREKAIYESLTPHTALHARRLLEAVPQLVMTSGRRSAERNREVGGVPTSAHLDGRAVDFDGSIVMLVHAAFIARRQRVTPRCSGPEEVLHEHKGRTGEHLHIAW